MATAVIIGAQWGDEGKGKVVDVLAGTADLVVRFQGGNNAGHTLVVEGDKTVLHLIPSGILQPSVTNVIAQGTVVDLEVLLGELAALRERGLLSSDRAEEARRLVVSDRAAVIMPYHVAIDKLRETRLAGGKIGTTGRGIGPAYEDVAARRAVRVGDLLDADRLKARLDRVLAEKNAVLEWLGGEPFETGDLIERMTALGERVRHHVGDAGRLVRGAASSGKRVLFEGAQGTLLDVLHGTYPYVTSSNTSTAGVAPGAGLPPSRVRGAIGVVKAYLTRVGEGPFPTELLDETGERLRATGHEFGATTGRPRRCGWLDLPALRYSHRLNGFASIALTKLDVLTGLPELKVCTGYRVGGALDDELPVGRLERAEPVYETLPGWSDDITAARSLSDLPRAARDYIRFIEEQADVTVSLVGVGPGRSETIVAGDLWVD